MAALTRSYPGLTRDSDIITETHPVFRAARPFTVQTSLSAVTSDMVSYSHASQWILDNFKLR